PFQLSPWCAICMIAPDTTLGCCRDVGLTRRRLMRTLVAALATTLACVLIVPGTAVAQSAIAGTVKDTSGAVLPGVTVEVSSPALIEKTRTGVTDAQGNYKIVELRPGCYS